MWWRDLVERLEDFSLHGQVFCHCFDHERRIIERREISCRANAFDDGLLGFCVESFFIDVALQALIDRIHSTFEKLFADVVHDHVIARARSNLRNPIPHRPRTNYTNDFSHTEILSVLCTLVSVSHENVFHRRGTEAPESLNTYRSIAIATALPPPRHNETIPRRASRRFNS